MQYSISQDVIEKTTKCIKNKQCLSAVSCYCKVEKIIGKDVVFVQCLHTSICNYQIHFGHGIICNCPIRNELSSKYSL